MKSVKLKELADKAQKVALCASTMAMMAPCTAFANGNAFFQDHGIKVNTSVDTTTIINRLINVVAGVFIVIGIFQVATAIFKLLEANAEDNAAASNKAVKQLCIGGLFIGAPALLIFLFA